jgi:hypothetical protein
MTPALLTSMSTAGCLSTISAAARLTESSEARSRSTISREARGCEARMSLRARSTFCRLRAAMTTWAPAPASALEVSRPRPMLAPVTTATFPLRSGMSSTFQDTLRSFTQ